MISKEILKDKQEVVFNILNNSLKQDTLAHAYLFSGIRGSLQYETVDLFVSSLVCDHEGWACGECSNCLRVQNSSYPDYLILDGSQGLIKKQDVINLQTQFSLTALEKSSYKIFLIKEAHNMTASAANSLLKFLEEPSDYVIGILVSDQVEAILPTVISRCTVLDFKRLPYEESYRLALEAGLDPIDAYYYSKVLRVSIDLEGLEENEVFKLFKINFESFIKTLIQEEDQALYILQSNLLKHPDKEELNRTFVLLLDMLIVFFKDVINDHKQDGLYGEMIDAYRTRANYTHYLEVTLEIKNKVANHINLPLLVDQFIYKIREGK